MRIYILVVLLILAGCFNKHPVPPPIDDENPMTWLWSSDSYKHVGTVVVSSPFPIGDSLVIMSAGRNIRMHNQETGNLYWETFIDSGTNLQIRSCITDGELLFAAHVQDVRAWDIITGDQVWLTDFPDDRGSIGSEIVYQDGRLYIGGFHHVYCITSETGSLIWSHFLGDSTVSSALAIDNSKLYVPTAGFKPQGVIVLDINTGDSLHNYIVNETVGTIAMAPVIEDSVMYIATSWRFPFSIDAWNINTHELIWHTEKPNYEFIADHAIIVDELIIVSLAPYGIGAWNKHTGRQEWITYPTQNYNWSRIGYDGTWVYYQHGWKIQVIDPPTGNIVYSANGPDGESIYRTTVANGKIFVHSYQKNMCFTTYNPE